MFSCTTPGIWCSGPAEAFTSGALAELFDVNVLSCTPKSNRVALPSERFRRSEHHMPGVVHENIEPALLGDNLADPASMDFSEDTSSSMGRKFNLIVVRKLFHVRSLRRVPTGGIPHRGVDSVAGLREGIGGQTAKAARKLQ